MVQSQFSLSWDSYKSNICNGFSLLQQNGEFVDMTLAADGHYVKVHQVLMALASPYLKELMASAPCQHPVIFLNNVSYTTLSLLLEYIYTGEVLVPANNLSSFMETARTLHIKGLETALPQENLTTSVGSMHQSDENELNFGSGLKRLPIVESIEKIGLPAKARRILVKQESLPETSLKAAHSYNTRSSKEDSHGYSDMEDSIAHEDYDDDYSSPAKISKTSEPKAVLTANTNLQFTVSIRGSLQVILNRYIYNLNSTQNSGVRRWRCIDYRNNKCMAFLVTKGNVVLNRANLHSHSYHDKKILAKIEKNAVFSALDDVETYKEKEFNKDVENTIVESDDYESFEVRRDLPDLTGVKQ